MKILIIKIIKVAGFFLTLGCASPAKVEQVSLELNRPIGYTLDDAPAPFGIASYALYQTQMAKNQHLQRLRKPMTTWLLLRVTPPQLPAYQVKHLWLLGFMIVILPGIILRTLYKKNV